MAGDLPRTNYVIFFDRPAGADAEASGHQVIHARMAGHARIGIGNTWRRQPADGQPRVGKARAQIGVNALGMTS